MIKIDFYNLDTNKNDSFSSNASTNQEAVAEFYDYTWYNNIHARIIRINAL